ncbi:hypothetical protein NMG60_11018458, partial [Bertholletia excelsa]
MEPEIKAETQEHDQEKWVYDSSLDHKGQVPLRASTGVWRASLFIIAIEFSERLSYFAIASNLISYLTHVIHQDHKTAAKNVNYWTGVTTMMPLVGAFLADAYTGRFPTILVSSVLYLMGLGLLTMSQFFPSLKPRNTTNCVHPRKLHEIVFFLGMYLISVGTGGHKPCLESFGADQFDDDYLEERKKKMSYFNLWNFALCCGLLLGVTIIVYVQDRVSWGVANLILALTMALTILMFCLGRPFYRYRMPEGSPLTPILQVLVAAIRKRNLECPSNPALLYEVSKSEKRRFLCHTSSLRFLDKAAIIEGNKELTTIGGKQPNAWRLATVTKVEETKLVINIIPIWLTSLTFGIFVAQGNTFFIEQSSTMDREIINHFKIPPASMVTISALGWITLLTVYEKALVPALRQATGNERGLEILQRIGIGMSFSILSTGLAAQVEKMRLAEVKTGEVQHMSVLWLAPQFIISGIGDGFTLVGLQEFFYDQVPDSMRSLGMALYLSVIGLGSFLSSLLITIVDHVTENEGTSWIDKDLNRSRLDKFYWLLTVVYVVNLCIYVMVARKYKYKSVRSLSVADCYE